MAQGALLGGLTGGIGGGVGAAVGNSGFFKWHIFAGATGRGGAGCGRAWGRCRKWWHLFRDAGRQ